MVEKNRKRIIIIIVILLIIALVAGYFFILKNKNNKEFVSEEGEYTEITEKEEEYTDLTEEEIEDIDAVIESKLDNKIEKDGIEAKSIQLKNYGNQLEVKTTFVNNNDETVNGFSFEIELQNNSGKEMTTISGSYNDLIEKGGEAEVVNYVVNLKNMSQIKKAKILNIEIGTAKENIEKEFEDMPTDIEE